MATALPPCPNCGSEETHMLVWGLPGPEALERAQREPITFGGCLVPSGGPWPNAHCPVCQHQWVDATVTYET